MGHNSDTNIENILREIIRTRGISPLEDGKILVAMFRDMSGEKKDQRIIQYFAECGGHTALLEAKTLSPSMQKARFNQTVSKMCAETLVSEEAARQVCNAFWSAVYGRPMEEAAAMPQQDQKVQQQKIQPVQEIQQENKAQQSQQVRSETEGQPPTKNKIAEKKYYTYFDKPVYYISHEEAEKGGEIAVYYLSDKLYITIPPHTSDDYEVRPINHVRVVDPEKCSFTERNERYYSDTLIQAFVKHGCKKRIWESLGSTCLIVGIMYTATVVLGGGLCLASVWEDLPTIMLDFSSIKNAISSIFSIAYWTWPLLVVIKGDLLGDIREYLDLKKKLQKEIERRKTLPLR